MRNAKPEELTVLQQAVSKPVLCPIGSHSLICQGCSLQECVRMGGALGGLPLQTVSGRVLTAASTVSFHHNIKFLDSMHVTFNIVMRPLRLRK